MKAFAFVAAVVLLVLWPNAAGATVVLSLNNPGSTTLHEIEVEPGDTFDVDVNLTTSESLFLITTALRASESDVLAILDVVDTSPWSSAWWGPSLVGDLDPQSQALGSGVPFPAYFGPGAANLAVISFLVDPAAPMGSYTLDVVDPRYFWSRFSPVEPLACTAGPSFIVRVVPEPGAGALCLLMSNLPLCRRRR